MCSSSSVDPFATWLATSFTLLARDAPLWHDAVCAHLAGRRVGLTIDRERLSVVFSASTIQVERGPGEADLAVCTSRATILDVLDGHLSLAMAVEEGRVTAIGPVHVLTAALDALRWYVHGAVRAPSLSVYLDHYRRSPV